MGNEVTIRLAVSGMAQVDAALSRLKSGVTSAFSSINSTVIAMTGLGGSLSVAAGLLAVGAGVKSITELGGKMKDLSTQTGASVEKLMLYRTALEDAGVPADSVGQIFAKMSKALVDAADVGGPAAQEIQKIGLSLSELVRMDPASQFEAISTAVAKLPTSADRAAAAMKIFGKSGAELIPFFSNSGALGDAEKTLGRLPRLLAINAELFDAISDSIGHIKIKSQQLFVGFASIIGPEIKKITDLIDKIDLTKAGEKAGAFLLLVKQQWSDGTLSELIGLSIDAGFELGENAAKRVFASIVDFLSRFKLWQSITYGIAVAMADADIAARKTFAELAKWVGDVMSKAILYSVSGALAAVSLIPGAQAVSSAAFSAVASGLSKASEAGKSLIDVYTEIGIAGTKAAREAAKVGLGIPGVDTTQSTAAWDALKARMQGMVDKINATKPAPFKGPGEGNEPLKQRFDLLAMQLELKTRMLGIDEQVASLEADFSKTDADRFAKRKEFLEYEMALLRDRIEILGVTAAAEQDVAEKNKLLTAQLQLQKELSGIKQKQERFGPDPNSFADQWVSAFTEVRNSWGTVARNIADVGKSAMGGMTKFLSNGLDDMIWKTGSLRDLWVNFAHTITSSVTQAISNMFMEWITKEGAKTAASIAGANAETAAKAPSALMTSITSFGTAALIGGAAFVAAMALTGGFREQGGPVEAGRSYIVGEKRPEVFVPSVSGYIIPSVSQAVGSSPSFDLPTPQSSPAPRFSPIPSVSQSSGGSSSAQPATHFIVIDSMAAAEKHARSVKGRALFTRLGQEQALEVGHVG